MKIAMLTPGSGDNFYCENCLRDQNLAQAWRQQGHDAVMVPLYLPVRIEGPMETPVAPMFMGGINVYLQQRWPLFRRTPRWLDRLFDAPGLLRWLARRAGATDAAVLGATTVSLLQGEHGRQGKELQRLATWLGRDLRPDAICVSNILLGGLARPLRAASGAVMACLLHDEDEFLEVLPEPYRAEAWALVAERAADFDILAAVSDYYADYMRQRLGSAGRRITVVRPGIALPDSPLCGDCPRPLAIGYLSRLCREKGFDLLAEAFIRLKRNVCFRSLKLLVAGGRAPADEPFAREVCENLLAAGVIGDVVFLPSFDAAARQRFFASIAVLCVPERRGPAYGRYSLEALSYATPLVVPAVGAMPEVIEHTGGGLLTPPDDPAALAEALEKLLLDGQAAREMGRRGRQGLQQHFDPQASALALANLLADAVHCPPE